MHPVGTLVHLVCLFVKIDVVGTNHVQQEMSWGKRDPPAPSPNNLSSKHWYDYQVSYHTSASTELNLGVQRYNVVAAAPVTLTEKQELSCVEGTGIGCMPAFRHCSSYPPRAGGLKSMPTPTPTTASTHPALALPLFCLPSRLRRNLISRKTAPATLPVTG